MALLDFESNQVEDKLASSQDTKFLDVSFAQVNLASVYMDKYFLIFVMFFS